MRKFFFGPTTHWSVRQSRLPLRVLAYGILPQVSLRALSASRARSSSLFTLKWVAYDDGPLHNDLWHFMNIDDVVVVVVTVIIIIIIIGGGMVIWRLSTCHRALVLYIVVPEIIFLALNNIQYDIIHKHSLVKTTQYYNKYSFFFHNIISSLFFFYWF